MPESKHGHVDPNRDSQVRCVIDEYVRNRGSSNEVPIEQILSEHAQLMPELGEQLRRARMIGAARMRAEGPIVYSSTHSIPIADSSDSPSGPSSDAIPGYRILREIHRGGQGVVYQAIQETTGQKRAIKIMREGALAGANEKARFDREKRVLAYLDHPNIVGILDSGTASGHFYFVMDYISGQALDVYIADRRPTIREILELFATICEAVNAAHLRGVIHRDLKPGNIVVDHSGKPFVLDFGLAHSVAGEDPGVSHTPLMTLTGQFVGSVPWSSPEQVEAIPGTIDTRTDVYALGLILYHMLTGQFPYDVTGSVRDIMHNVLTAEPARPGTLRPDSGDEIETIVLKCLSKERQRRYQVAGDVAREIRRYLAGDPIEAKADSTWYVLKKSLRRHRVPVSVAGLLAVLIMVFGIVVLVMNRNLSAARDESVRQANLARQTLRFQTGIFKSLDPARGADATVRSMLDDAARRVGSELADSPESEAEARETIGNAYRRLGFYDEAETQLRESLSIRRSARDGAPAALASNLSTLAWVLCDKGEYHEADRLFHEAMDLRRSVFGDKHVKIATLLHNLALVQLKRGNLDESQRLYHQALAMRRELLGNEHSAVALTLDNLGVLYLTIAKLDEAEPLLREALTIRRKLFSDYHPDLATSLNNMGALQSARGRHREAVRQLREALTMNRALYGQEHPQVATVLNQLATSLMRQGRAEEAEAAFLEALTMRRRVLRADHPAIATTLNNLAWLLMKRDQPGGAEPLLREALTIRQRAFGADHWRTANVEVSLGHCLMLQARYEEAEPLLLRGHETIRRELGASHSRTRGALKRVLSLYKAWDKPEKAAAIRAKWPTTGAESD